MLHPTLSSLTLLVLVPELAFAQALRQGQPLKSLSLEQLANVEITTVTKQPERALDTPSSIYVITGDDIRRSGATTLPDALRLAPGVIVSQSDANRWAVGIRGFADIFSKNVLVLIDGRSVYTPLVGGVHWAIQDVLLSDVDRIEVIRGPGGSVWGANAVNGVINIISKSTAATQGLRVRAATGNVEHGVLGARFGGRAGRVNYRVHGKAFSRGAQFHEDGTRFDEWRSLQGGFRGDWQATARDTLSLSGDVYTTQVGERAEVSLFEPPSLRIVDGEVDLAGGHLIARWERAFTGGARSTVQAYYDHTSRHGFTFGEQRDTWDLDVSVRAPAGRHTVSSGFGARVSPSTVTQVVPTLNFLPSQHTHRVLSAFVADDVSLVPGRLAAGGGLKLEHNTYTGVELLPSAQMLWTPTADQRVWLSVRRAVRTPSRFERDLDFQLLIDPATPVYAAVVGNPEFGTESVIGSEAGYRHLLGPNLFVDLVAFDNRYEGLAGFGAPAVGLAAAPIPYVRVTLPFENVVDGRSRGVEVSPDWKPRADWRLSGSYSYLHLALRNREGFADTSQRDNYLGMSPRHQVRVQSRIDLPRRVQFDQTYRYVGELRSWDLPAYHALDARLGWAWSPALELSLVGQNLTDARHAEYGAVPVQIRRSVYAQLTLTR